MAKVKKKEYPDTIYVRIDKKLAGQFKAFVERTKAQGLSERSVIENLVTRYMRLAGDTDRVEYILGGAALDEWGDLVYQEAWADHAFSAKRWPWAIQEYHKLIAMVHCPLGYKLLALYRISFSWIEIAIEMRNRALTASRSSEHYRAAIEACFLALAYIEEFEKSDNTSSPVQTYNKACCYAMAAQYSVEEIVTSLEGKPVVAKLDADAKTKDPQLRERDILEKVWEFLGAKWREKVQAAGSEKANDLESRVMGFADRSVTALEELSDRLDSDSTYSALVGSMLTAADTDADFAFLRQDAKVKDRFKKWQSRGEDSVDALSTYRVLLQSVDKKVSAAVSRNTGWSVDAPDSPGSS